MHCLVLAGTFPNRHDPWRGPYNRRQIECLAALCDVTVINPLPWHELLKGALPWDLVEGPDDVLEDVRLFHPVLWHVPVIGRGHTWRGVAAAARRVLRSRGGEQFDVILATFAYPHGAAARVLARELGIPYAIKTRGSDLHSLPAGGKVRTRTAEALRGAAAVVAVSGNLASIATDLGAAPERVHLLPNGIDAGAFPMLPRQEARGKLGIEGTRALVLFVGHLLPVKGVDILVESLRDDSFRVPWGDVDVVLAGEGPMRSWVEANRRERRELPVRLLGRLSREQVALWMNAADVVVLPSRNEGCPNVVLEALCCGTPVVAARVGGVPDLLDDSCGVLCRPEDPGALATALGEALGRRWDRTAIRRRVEGMSWEKNARQLHEILRAASAPERK